MNDSIFQDSLNVGNHLLTKSIDSKSSINWWMWIALVEFLIIILLIFIKRSRNIGTPKQKFKEDSLKQEVDFKNIINSSFYSISLYDELKVKCHPDRFSTDKEKNTIADNLFQEITKNKTNLKRLLELKEEAKQKLDINF